MSESLGPSSEHHKNSEEIDLAEQSRKNLEKLREKAEKAAEKSPDDVRKIEKAVETQAVSGKEFTVGESESTSHGKQTYIDQKALKKRSYEKTMRHVRQKLTKNERRFSKVIHNKGVESVSEVSSKTVARPSGIIGGGVFALLGSLFLLYMTKNYGFEYNYFVFLMLFVGGFFVGMLAELMLKTVLKR